MMERSTYMYVCCVIVIFVSETVTHVHSTTTEQWCGAAGINNSLNGIQCSGMRSLPTVKSLGACSAACCTDKTCGAYLFSDGMGCYTDTTPCKWMANDHKWQGATKLALPPTPAPTPPPPPPPLPNVLTQMLYGGEGCTGGARPHMTSRLSTCTTNLPFPQDRTNVESKATLITGSGGINSTDFTVSIYNATGCQQDLCSTFSITPNLCTNASAFGLSTMWIRTFAPNNSATAV
eukprot:m.212154 g.212154  ORF g.212154 m.212154 type:complete len:234 (-) comp33120_c0_seq3:12-713(-)